MSDALQFRPLDANPTKPIIGLLGAPGAGKSLVADQLAQLGCRVINADRLAQQALDEPAIRQQLVEHFGDRILDGDGRIDRKALGRRVFDDPAELKQLEATIHPYVNQQRRALHQVYQAEPNVKAIVEDSPLLLEKSLASQCDVLVLVEAPREQRLARLHEHRGWDAQELARRENRQAPLDTKRQQADYIVHNDADPNQTLARVQGVLYKILQAHIAEP